MADLNKLIGHILFFEGGHSANPKDGCAKLPTNVKGKVINPATGRAYDAKHPENFIHTNKGVCYMTYLGYCTKKKRTPVISEYLEMPFSLWKDIYKVLFWDVIQGDKIKLQGIAEFLVDAIWGSGQGGVAVLIKQIQSYLNAKFKTTLQPTGRIDTKTLAALNQYISTDKIYQDFITFLYDKRLQFLKTAPSWSWANKGWVNRLNKLTERIRKYKITDINLLLLFLPLVFFIK